MMACREGSWSLEACHSGHASTCSFCFLAGRLGSQPFFLQTPSTMILPTPPPHPKARAAVTTDGSISAKISSSSLGGSGIYHSREAMTRKIEEPKVIDSMVRQVSPSQPSHSVHVLHRKPGLRHSGGGLLAPGIPESEFQD